MGRLKALAARYDRVYRWIGPVLSLKTGLVAVLLIRRGLDFAPLAVGALLLAWMLAGVLLQRLVPRAGEHGFMRFLRFAATTVVAAVYQNVLFFLLPIWFASATFWSINLVAPALLAAMALLTCFDHFYAEHVLRHPARRAAFSAVILFAALVASAPIFVRIPLRAIFAAAAATSVLLGAAGALPFHRLRTARNAGATLAAAIVAAIAMSLAAPLFPPVPVECTGRAAATAIADREPAGAAASFDAGTPRIYAWFAIAAPDRYSETLRFEWFRDGERLGKAFETEFTGGRKNGFRTWGYLSAPKPGKYRVDLYAGSDQLLARHRFVVVPHAGTATTAE